MSSYTNNYFVKRLIDFIIWTSYAFAQLDRIINSKIKYA